MGYSISVNCVSKEAQAQMNAFLKANFRHWDEVIGSPNENRRVSDVSTDDLSYAHRKNQIGFDYGGMTGPRREYYNAVLRWVAIQVGKRRTKFRVDEKSYTFEEPVPAFIYDVESGWPVLLKRPKDKDLRWCWVDRLGMNRDGRCIAENSVILMYQHLFKFTRKDKKKGITESCEVDPRVYEVLGVSSIDHDSKTPLWSNREMQYKLMKALIWDKVLEEYAPIKSELTRLDKLWKKSS